MYETLDYDKVVGKMRLFFREREFIEVPTQSRLSILAACEDPKTISQFVFDGVNYPLPQTGQMWLEYEMLKNPDIKGVYCLSTSYRNEPNPIEGRHQKIFPMFEFESKGNQDELLKLESELLTYLGFKSIWSEESEGMQMLMNVFDYEDICIDHKIDSIEAEHEEMLCKKHGSVVFLKNFPQRSHPFWNMKQSSSEDGIFNKIDVIMHGQETIGSAERSCDANEMYENFMSISDGDYSNLLFKQFTQKRVLLELDEYLHLDFFPRFGAGIGVNRMARAMKLEGLI
jgi:aspartyl/asparaginyl-tRNA synthetase